MFVRFVVQALDRDSGRRQGLFQALSDLEYEGVLLPHEQTAYDEIYDWFRANLKKPRSFSRSSKPHAKNVAIGWFKDTATEHISKMHEMAHILAAHGVSTTALNDHGETAYDMAGAQEILRYERAKSANDVLVAIFPNAPGKPAVRDTETSSAIKRIMQAREQLGGTGAR